MAKKLSLVEFLIRNKACSVVWVKANYRKGFRKLYAEAPTENIFWLAKRLGLANYTECNCSICMEPFEFKRRFSYKKMLEAFEQVR